MKLQFPFKDYTDEEIMNAHGDERGQMLLANSFRTFENIQFLLIVLLIISVVGGVIYLLTN